MIYRPMFGQYGKALPTTHATFMSQAGIAAGVPAELGLERLVLPVSRTRTIGKHNMVRNSELPEIKVDPETFKVTLNGKVATIDPAEELPLNHLFFLV